MKFLKETIAIVAFVCCMSLGLFLSGCGCGEKYTITFDSQGGTDVNSMKISKNCTLRDDEQNLPQNPTKFGYVYMGWYTDKACTEGCEFDIASKVTKDITVYAKWVDQTTLNEMNLCTVTFNTGKSTVVKKIAKGTCLKEEDTPKLTNDTLVLTGWSVDVGGGGFLNIVYDYDMPLYEDITLNPIWKTKSGSSSSSSSSSDSNIALINDEEYECYTVIYHPEYTDASGKAASISTIDYIPEISDKFKSKTYNNEGYTLVGWYTAASGGNKVEEGSKVTSDMDVYARWKKNDAPTQTADPSKQHTITYQFNGGQDSSGNNAGKSIISEGLTPELPTISRDGYTFGGWYLDENYKNEYTLKPISNDFTLYAKWTKNNSSGGSSGSSGGVANCVVSLYYWRGPAEAGSLTVQRLTLASGSKLTEADSTPPAVSGYVFSGWYLGDNYSEADKWDMNTQVIKSTVLYAKWTKNQGSSTPTVTNTYKVTFNKNCNDTVNNMPAAQDVKEGALVKEPTTPPTRSGYQLKGWYKEAACNNGFNFETSIKADITLYAGWEVVSSTGTPVQLEGNFEYEDSAHKVIVGVTAEGRAKTELTIPAGVETIKSTFGGNKSGTLLSNNPYKLVKLTIPSSVKVIEEGAFSMCYALWIVDCKATNITNGKNSTKLSFSNMETRKLYFANGEHEMDFTGNRPMVKSGPIVYYSPKENVYYAVTTTANSSTYYVNYDSKCTVISGYCFYGCSNLASISIDKSVEQIYYRAFADCTKLYQLSWVSSGENTIKLKSISANAFENCSALTSIMIPNRVSFIGANAFVGSGLTSADFVYKRCWEAKDSNDKITIIKKANLESASTAATYLKSIYTGEWTCAVYGDIYGDGVINNRDATLLSLIAAGQQTCSEDEKFRADLNSDGVVDAIDHAMLYLYLNEKWKYNGVDLPFPYKVDAWRLDVKNEQVSGRHIYTQEDWDLA